MTEISNRALLEEVIRLQTELFNAVHCFIDEIFVKKSNEFVVYLFFRFVKVKVFFKKNVYLGNKSKIIFVYKTMLFFN